MLAIGRQARPELYNLHAVKPPPLVAESLRFGVARTCGRFRRDNRSAGSTSTQFDRCQTETRASGISGRLFTVFICPSVNTKSKLLKRLSPLNVPLSISHQILPEYREFERTSTVVINAYLQPLMGRLSRRLQDESRNIVHFEIKQRTDQSQSPLRPYHAVFRRQHLGCVAAEEPVRTILSGPPVALSALCKWPALQVLRRSSRLTWVEHPPTLLLCESRALRITNEACCGPAGCSSSVGHSHRRRRWWIDCPR